MNEQQLRKAQAICDNNLAGQDRILADFRERLAAAAERHVLALAAEDYRAAQGAAEDYRWLTGEIEKVEQRRTLLCLARDRIVATQAHQQIGALRDEIKQLEAGLADRDHSRACCVG